MNIVKNDPAENVGKRGEETFGRKGTGVPAPQITPDMIRNSKNVTCDCGGVFFQEKMLFKIISPLLTSSGREEMQMIPVIICDKCGLIPSVFDPQNIISEELKTRKTKISDNN